MVLYHVTLQKNLQNIMKKGLLLNLSQEDDKSITFVKKERLLKSIDFIKGRHEVSYDDLIILEVNVPRKQLCQEYKEQFYVQQDINSNNIINVIDVKNIREIFPDPDEELYPNVLDILLICHNELAHYLNG